jgi:sugar phosphate permease
MTVLERDPRLIAITLTCMLLSSSQFIMNAFLTITAVTVVHTSVHVAGFALALAFVAAIVGRLGWGFVSDRCFAGDRLVPLAIICAIAAAGTVMLAFTHAGSIALLFAASLLLGMSASGWNGLMATALSEVGGTERAASALGVGLTGMFAASAVAPWLFGLLADRVSLAVGWAGVAVMVLIAMVPVLWLRVNLPASTRGLEVSSG